MTISSLTGEYFFLNNFYEHPDQKPIAFNLSELDDDGRPVVLFTNCVENAYQAYKTFDYGFQRKILGADTPKQAKEWGNMIPLRSDWDEVKVTIMLDLLRQKFVNAPDLRSKLISVEGNIVHSNSHGDDFWGVCKKNGTWEGLNWLGRLLVIVRSEILNSCDCCFAARGFLLVQKETYGATVDVKLCHTCIEHDLFNNPCQQ